MAAISITAASVLGSANAERLSQFKSAAAITAGQYVYLNASNAWALVDDNASLGTETTAIRGFAENSAPAAGQPLTVVIADDNFTLGGTLTNGKVVYAFTTAGAVSIDDIPTTGSKPIVAGIAISASAMRVVRNGFASGVVI